MIVKVITKEMFFNEMGGSFSSDACDAIYDYIDDAYSDDDPYKLHPGDLLMEFFEFDTVQEALEEYDMDDIDDLSYRTWCVELYNGGIVLMTNF